MKFFSQLYDSLWRQHGDEFSKARQNRHYGSMAEQVMANRNELLHLQGELDRVSHDLSQALTLNRALVKLLVSDQAGPSSPLNDHPEDCEHLGPGLKDSQQDLSLP